MPRRKQNVNPFASCESENRSINDNASSVSMQRSDACFHKKSDRPKSRRSVASAAARKSDMALDDRGCDFLSRPRPSVVPVPSFELPRVDDHKGNGSSAARGAAGRKRPPTSSGGPLDAAKRQQKPLKGASDVTTHPGTRQRKVGTAHNFRDPCLGTIPRLKKSWCQDQVSRRAAMGRKLDSTNKRVADEIFNQMDTKSQNKAKVTVSAGVCTVPVRGQESSKMSLAIAKIKTNTNGMADPEVAQNLVESSRADNNRTTVGRSTQAGRFRDAPGQSSPKAPATARKARRRPQNMPALREGHHSGSAETPVDLCDGSEDDTDHASLNIRGGARPYRSSSSSSSEAQEGTPISTLAVASNASSQTGDDETDTPSSQIRSNTDSSSSAAAGTNTPSATASSAATNSERKVTPWAKRSDHSDKTDTGTTTATAELASRSGTGSGSSATASSSPTDSGSSRLCSKSGPSPGSGSASGSRSVLKKTPERPRRTHGDEVAVDAEEERHTNSADSSTPRPDSLVEDVETNAVKRQRPRKPALEGDKEEQHWYDLLGDETPDYGKKRFKFTRHSDNPKNGRFDGRSETKKRKKPAQRIVPGQAIMNPAASSAANQICKKRGRINDADCLDGPEDEHRMRNRNTRQTGVNPRQFHEKTGQEGTARVLRSSSKRRPSPETIEIELSESESESESEFDTRQSHGVRIDAARISIGKKVFFSECTVSFDQGKLTLSYRKTQNRGTRGSSRRNHPGSGEKVDHFINLLEDHELLEIKYHCVHESDEATLKSFDNDSDLMSFIALKVNPNKKSSLDVYPNAYNPRSKIIEKQFILLEFRSDSDCDCLLKAMKTVDSLKPFVSDDSRLKGAETAEYSKPLRDHSNEEEKLRLKSVASPSHLTRRNQFLANRSENDTLLVYPFKGDLEKIEQSLCGLSELPSADTKVPSVASVNSGVVDVDTGNSSTRSAEAVRKDTSCRSSKITIKVCDYERLEPEEFLNDSLIDFWMRWMTRHDTVFDTHYFSSHFYTTLCDEGVDAVTKWTKNRGINVFEKKFLFFTINMNLHWSECVVVNPDFIMKHRGYLKDSDDMDWDSPMPCILFFDSLKAHRMQATASQIYKFLNSEWKRLKSTCPPEDSNPFTRRTMKVYAPRIPYQNNGWDCGVFVCRYSYAMYQLRHMNFSYAEVYGTTNVDIKQNRRKPSFPMITKGEVFSFGMPEIVDTRHQLKSFIERLSNIYIPWKVELEKKEKEERLAAKKARQKKRAAERASEANNTSVDTELELSASTEESVEIVDGPNSGVTGITDALEDPDDSNSALKCAFAQRAKPALEDEEDKIDNAEKPTAVESIHCRESDHKSREPLKRTSRSKRRDSKRVDIGMVSQKQAAEVELDGGGCEDAMKRSWIKNAVSRDDNVEDRKLPADRHKNHNDESEVEELGRGINKMVVVGGTSDPDTELANSRSSSHDNDSDDFPVNCAGSGTMRDGINDVIDIGLESPACSSSFPSRLELV